MVKAYDLVGAETMYRCESDEPVVIALSKLAGDRELVSRTEISRQQRKTGNQPFHIVARFENACIQDERMSQTISSQCGLRIDGRRALLEPLIDRGADHDDAL